MRSPPLVVSPTRAVGLDTRSSRVAASLLCLALGACGDASNASQDVDTEVPEADTLSETVQPDAEVVVFDSDALETSDDTGDLGEDVVSGGFGAPCQGNGDCISGWCVEGVAGYICTSECREACPDGYDCKSVSGGGGDIVFLCVPRVLKLCTPCIEDFQCSGGACLDIDGARRCASSCGDDAPCPEAYTCSQTARGDFCVPRSGSCECTPALADTARTCLADNTLGTCPGIERCDPLAGWVGCTARQAEAEACDYLDNDCDGEVDEDFKVEGLYVSRSGCGSCTTDCDQAIGGADETACEVRDGRARCVVVACAEGFVALNDFVCVPEAENTCAPCTNAAECLGVGSACTMLGDGTFCTRACNDGGSCPVGFACRATEGGEQCVPESGSCTCDGSDTTLARTCSQTYEPEDPNEPSVTCRGIERCTTSGWGGCELPDERCDGIDNDCDGEVDGPFKRDGRYVTVEHCGACNASCLALARPNAAPVCLADGVVPTCGYVCTGGAIDVNGLGDDGCECVPLPGPDLAGDHLDTNCDGVDGDVALAIFVSKEGRDDSPGTREEPVASLGIGIARAIEAGKRDVYVASGVYGESITLADGLGIFGGYSPDFATHEPLLYETALIPDTPTAERPATVVASDVGAAVGTRDTILDGFTIFGTNAANTPGSSSYAILIEDSGPRLRITHNRIFAGPGGRGEAGQRGSDGQVGSPGSLGTDARNTGGCPPASGNLGGNGGARTCGATDVGGGAGGRADCPLYNETPIALNAGANGRGTSAGTGGAAGWDLLICAGAFASCNFSVQCQTCFLPPNNNRTTASPGTNGTRGAHGSVGPGAQTGVGQVLLGRWLGASGGNGGSGLPGSGGGGGGAGGGVEMAGTACLAATYGDDDVGGSGGGGGSGGCGATGGRGGTAGGGSFGILIVSTSSALPTISDNAIHGGRGGDGGNGGPGGVGGVGGQGGTGGQPGDVSGGELKRCAAGGAAGGNGGDGGHGGGGGGGAGGAAYGIYASVPGAPPEAWRTANTFPTLGVGGGGGLGGVSLEPTRSGTTGATGVAGTVNF